MILEGDILYCDKERLKCIWNREDIPHKLLSLKKLLEEKNMDQYYNVCVNRIFDTEPEDNLIYVTRNFDDIRLSDEGIFVYREILSGYLGNDFVIDSYRKLLEINQNITYANNVYEAFRRMNVTDILKLIKKKYNSDHSPSTIKRVKIELICEILSRSPINILRIKLSKKIQSMIDRMIIKFKIARIEA